MNEIKVPQLFKNRSEFYRGLDTLEQWEKFLSEHQNTLGIGFIGRSNVGKSSMINSLFGKKMARTSNTPGRTRQINVFKLSFPVHSTTNREIFYYDLPGYGHAAVSKEQKKLWQSLIDSFFNNIDSKSLLIQIQDARHPMMAADKEFSSYMQQYPFKHFLLFNKIDKLKTQKERSVLEKLKPLIYKTYKSVSQIYFTSTENYVGLESLESNIHQYFIGQEQV